MHEDEPPRGYFPNSLGKKFFSKNCLSAGDDKNCTFNASSGMTIEKEHLFSDNWHAVKSFLLKWHAAESSTSNINMLLILAPMSCKKILVCANFRSSLRI